MKINKKKILWIVLMGALIAGAFFVYRYINDRQVFARMDQGGVGDFPVSKRQYAAYLKFIEERDKADNFGSTTPEGTLELFVDALKKEDVSLATKYFVPEKQKKMEEDLILIIKNGRKEIVAGLVLDYEKKECLDYMDKCIFSSYLEEKKAWSETQVIKNKFTNKWKIESL